MSAAISTPLTAAGLRLAEPVTRRVLGSFALVDFPTGEPVSYRARIAVRSARIVELPANAAPVDIASVPVGVDTVKIVLNRAGRFVIFTAPLFEQYIEEFLNPVVPPLLTDPNPNRILRLRLTFAVLDAGPNHLPRLFDVDLPRSPQPPVTAEVFQVQRVELFRSPSAPVADGWSLLRVGVAEAATANPLPGVLIRVFRQPRAVNAEPIGVGLTEWRPGQPQGDALVVVTGLERFVPAQGGTFAESHPIEIDATRDTAFTGAAGTAPNVSSLLRGTGAGIVRRPPNAGASALTIVRPTTPLALRAANTLSVQLTLS